MEIHVDASELTQLGALLQRAPDGLRQDLVGDVAATAGLAQGLAREGAPVFRGTLANGIHTTPIVVSGTGGGIEISGSVIATAPHSIVMEEGRRPGAPMPPLEPIRRWVELKVRRGDLFVQGDAYSTTTHRRRRSGRNRESQIKGLAYVIARSIGRKGIRGRGFMRKASEKAQVFLNERVGATVARWVDKLNRDQ